MSETGAGGVFEWLNASAPAPGPRWSQQYQGAVVEADATVILQDKRFSGLTLWQYSDIKADDSDTAGCGQCHYAPGPGPGPAPLPYPVTGGNLSIPWDCAVVDVSCGRPKGQNNKGVVDFWRRRKLDFDAVAAIFAAAAA